MDATWPDSAVYSCRCGTLYTVTYWRWIDDVARPELTEQVRRDGPLEGSCPNCGAAPRAAATWLSVDPAQQNATLYLSPDRRAHVLTELREHLTALEKRPHATAHWLLNPDVHFWTVMDEETARRARRVEPMSLSAASGELILPADSIRTRPKVAAPSPAETTAVRARGKAPGAVRGRARARGASAARGPSTDRSGCSNAQPRGAAPSIVGGLHR